MATKRADPHRVKGGHLKPALPADRLLARNAFQEDVDKEVDKVSGEVDKWWRPLAERVVENGRWDAGTEVDKVS